MKRGFFNGFTDYWNARACTQNDRGTSTWLTIDASGTTAYIVPLTIGGFNEIYNVGTCALFQRIYIIPISTNPQYLSDVIRAVTALREVKPSVQIVFPTRIPITAGTVQEVAWVNADMVCTNKFVSQIGEKDPFFNPETDVFVCEFIPIESTKDYAHYAVKLTCNDNSNIIYPYIPIKRMDMVLETLHKINTWDAVAVPYRRPCFGGASAIDLLTEMDKQDIPENPLTFYHLKQLCAFDYSCDAEYQEMISDARLTIPGRLYIGHGFI